MSKEKMTRKEITEVVTTVVLLSTVLIDKCDILDDENAERVWVREIRKTGNRFRDELVKYTCRQSVLYNETLEQMSQCISATEKLSNLLNTKNIQSVIEFLEAEKESKD